MNVCIPIFSFVFFVYVNNRAQLLLRCIFGAAPTFSASSKYSATYLKWKTTLRYLVEVVEYLFEAEKNRSNQKWSHVVNIESAGYIFFHVMLLVSVESE